MNGLVELVFEKVPDRDVSQLVANLLQGAEVTEISHSELGRLEPSKVGDSYARLLKASEEPASVFVKSIGASLGGVLIRHPLVRILRYNESNEVAVVFVDTDVDATDRQDAVLRMAAGAKVLAQTCGVAKFYCGYEPATDDRTRLFCGDRIGPVKSI